MSKAATILAGIAAAYDENALDGDARKFWGSHGQHTSEGSPPDEIILYAGRGGKTLLTLGDCLRAREELQAIPAPRTEERIADRREYMRYQTAKAAMQGLLAGTTEADDDEPARFEDAAALAKEAVVYADALLDALEGK